MNQYEIAVLYHPDLEMDLSKATDKIERIFKENGAKITKTDNWGKRKLAYPINKQDHAIYVFYELELDPKSVAELDRQLRITDEAIRFLITKPDLKAMAKAEEAKAKRDKRLGGAKAEDEAEDSEDEDDE